MGEAQGSLFRPTFNRAAIIEEAKPALTEDVGALALREVGEALRLLSLLGGLLDHRRQDLITHPLAELILTRVLLIAQGWTDQDDADTLRDDPALRVAASTRKGDTPLHSAQTPQDPEGLASQPTHSRTQAMLASGHNRRMLHEILLTLASRRMQAAHGRRKILVLDVDSLFKEAHGHQEGVAHNGHYHASGLHPLVAFTDTGDLVGVMLRPGSVHTAADVRRFLTPILSALQEDCDELWLRIDAGYADGKLFAWLSQRGSRFITPLPKNPDLVRQVKDWTDRRLRKWAEEPAPEGKLREATREFWHKAKGWTFVCRVVCVLVERDARHGQLFHNQFFLATNIARPKASSEALLDCYRQRGTAEAHIGEFFGVVAPTTSSAQRIRQGAPIRKRRVGMAENEVSLLLGAIAYELMHALRCVLEEVTDEGWSLRRFRERVLKVACMVARHSRRLHYRIAASKAALWRLLAAALPTAFPAAEATA